MDENLAINLLWPFLLLPIYWFALSFEDFHQWSVRLKILEKNEKDEFEQRELRKTEGRKDGE